MLEQQKLGYDFCLIETPNVIVVLEGLCKGESVLFNCLSFDVLRVMNEFHVIE